jgi:hypothetical protein
MAENNELNDPTSGVDIAASVCPPAEADAGSTAVTVAKPPRTEQGKKASRRKRVTFTNTERHKAKQAPAQTIKRCEHCGQSYGTLRPAQSKFCSGNCRRDAWLMRNPERAAEMATKDKERLRAHLEGRGVAWQGTTDTV